MSWRFEGRELGKRIVPVQVQLSAAEAEAAALSAFQRATGSAPRTAEVDAALAEIARRMTDTALPAEWLTTAQAEELIAPTWGRTRLTLDAASQALTGTVGALGSVSAVTHASYRDLAVQSVAQLAPGSLAFSSWAALDLASGIAAAARDLLGASDPATTDVVARWTTASSLAFFRAEAAPYATSWGMGAEEAALAYAVGMLVDVAVRDATGQLGRDAAAYMDAVLAGTAPSDASIEGLGGATAYTVSIVLDGDTQVVTVTRSGANTEAADLFFEFTGVAEEGSDFTTSLNGGPLTMAAGSSTATFTIRTVEDGIVEPTEDLGIRLVSTSDGGAIVQGAVLVVIEDDDTQYAISIDRDATLESDTDILFVTVSRSGRTPDDTVALSFMEGPGMARLGTDFEFVPGNGLDPVTGTLAFAEGETEKVIGLQVLNDATFEGSENLQVAITGSAAGATLPSAPAAAIITDGPPPPARYSITVAPAELFEGALSSGLTGAGLTRSMSFGEGRVWDARQSSVLDDDVRSALVGSFSSSAPTGVAGPPATFVFTVARDVAGPAGQVQVDFVPGTNGAVLAEDYTLSGANVSLDAGTGILTVDFADGELERTFEATPVDDALFEEAETFTAILRTPLPGQGTALPGAGEAIARILDDDSLNEYAIASVAPATTAEGGAGLRFLISRTVSDGGATIDLAASLPDGMDVTDIAAIAGVDQPTLAGFPNFTVSFASGQQNVMVVVTFLDDAVVEADETFALTITDTRGTGTIGTPTASGVVVDDDSLYAIGPADAAIAEDASGTLVFTITRTGSTDAAETVFFDLLDGAGASDDDYIPSTTGSVSFAAGQSTATVEIDPVADADAESDETVTIRLVSTSGTGTIDAAASEAVATILDDDTPGNVYAISIAPASIREGEMEDTGSSGPGGPIMLTPKTFTVTVTRTESGEPATIDLSYGGTATPSVDFGGTTGGPDTTVTFTAGQTTASFQLTPFTDGLVEGNETIAVSIADTRGTGTVAPGSGTAVATIEDADAPLYGVARRGAERVSEDGGVLTFDVFRNFDDAAGTVEIDPFRAAGGITPDDVTVAGGTPTGTGTYLVSFAVGETSRTVTLTASVDLDLGEADEAVTLAIASVASGPGQIDTFNDSASGIVEDVPAYAVTVYGDDETTENFGSLDWRVTRSDTTDAASIRVEFDVADGVPGRISAADIYFEPYGGSYTPDPGNPYAGTLTFAAGEGTAGVAVDFQDDIEREGTETITLSIVDTNGTGEVLDASATGTVFDDDGPTYTIRSFSRGAEVFEEGFGEAVFRIERSDATSAANVQIGLTGSADQGVDYTLSSEFGPGGFVRFEAGETTAEFVATGVLDEPYEGIEDITATILAIDDGGTGVGQNTTRSLFDTRPSFTVRFEPSYAVDDPAFSGPRTMELIVSRNIAGSDVSVDLQLTGTADTSDYTVRGGGDFAIPAPLFFAAGETEVRLILDVTLDTDVEGVETVYAELSNAGGDYRTGSPATAVIRDDDTLPTYSVRPGTTRVTETDYSSFFRVERTDSAGDATVTLSITGGTATFDQDYTFYDAPITAQFYDGDTTADVYFDVFDDSDVEGRETVELSITDVTGGGTIDASPAVIFIEDDETGPAYSIAFTPFPGRPNEGDSPLGDVFTYTVSRSVVAGEPLGAASVEVLVDAASEATQGEDFVFLDDAGEIIANPVATFLAGASGDPGVSEWTGRLRIVGDTVPEESEYVYLGLADPSDGGSVTQSGPAGFQIRNDDFQTFYSVVAGTEGNIGDRNILEGSGERFQVTVSRTGVLDEAQLFFSYFGTTAGVATGRANGPGSSGQDWAFADDNGVLSDATFPDFINFRADQSEATFFIDVIDDAYTIDGIAPERDTDIEGLNLRIFGPSGDLATLGPEDPLNIALFITNDDTV